MTTERVIRTLAGTFVLVSLALGAPGSPVYVDSRWLFLATFVGLNLFQSGLTRFCPAEPILRKLGFRDACGVARTPDAGESGRRAA